MSWSNQYIGIPWSRDDHGMAETHCWGLARLVYREVLGIELDDFGPALDGPSNAEVIDQQRKLWPWHEVEQAKAFDLVVFRMPPIDDHIGIVIDKSLMLHVRRGTEAKAEPYGSSVWSRRLVGIYRHAERMEGGVV